MALVFDVNETLLDLNALTPHFERVFGTSDARATWFNLLIRSSMVVTILNQYRNFSELGSLALEATAQHYGVTLSDESRTAVFDALRHLPAYPDVPPALAKLKAAGFRMATLTNSTPQALEVQLTNAGIADFFEMRLSVDAVRRFKPSGEVYRLAVDSLGEPPEKLWMVAAHDWDIAGAQQAGFKTAFVVRQVFSSLAQPPDIVGRDMHEVAEKLLQM